jgi:hypothetical protein
LIVASLAFPLEGRWVAGDAKLVQGASAVYEAKDEPRPVETELEDGDGDVQGLAPALEESRERGDRPIVEVDTGAVLDLIDRIGMEGAGVGRARMEGDDRRRALWPLDARDYEVFGRARAAAAAWAGGGLADNGSEGFKGVNGVYWQSGVFVEDETVEKGVGRGDEGKVEVGDL